MPGCGLLSEEPIMAEYRIHETRGRLRVQQRFTDTKRETWRTVGYPTNHAEGEQHIEHLKKCETEESAEMIFCGRCNEPEPVANSCARQYGYI
jgi:hypothetical protein